MIQYCLDLILLFTLDYVRWRVVFDCSHWVETGIDVGGEKRHVEDQVDLPTGRKRQAISTGAVSIVGNWR
jgi:hypothetical protein